MRRQFFFLSIRSNAKITARGGETIGVMPDVDNVTQIRRSSPLRSKWHLERMTCFIGISIDARLGNRWLPDFTLQAKT